MNRTRLSLHELLALSPPELERVLAANRPVVLSDKGEPVGALLGLETLRRLEAELELLRSLSLGELESASGAGHPLAEVLKDCELLLDEN